MHDVIIVTGSRDFGAPGEVAYRIRRESPRLVVQGGCPTGADLFARQYCKANEIECITYKADWKQYGRAVGPIRNKFMLDDHPNAKVLAFRLNESKGTTDCIKQALLRKMQVEVFDFVRPNV